MHMMIRKLATCFLLTVFWQKIKELEYWDSEKQYFVDQLSQQNSCWHINGKGKLSQVICNANDKMCASALQNSKVLHSLFLWLLPLFSTSRVIVRFLNSRPNIIRNVEKAETYRTYSFFAFCYLQVFNFWWYFYTYYQPLCI